MAISVDWATGIISVPKSYMLLVQAVPTEIRELNIDTFRLDLKDLDVSLLVVGDGLEKETIQLSDFHLNAEFTGSELADLALYLPAVQYIALYTALREGTNPDQPRNLTQVVRL